MDVSQNPLPLSRKEIGISPNLDFSGESWREPHHQNMNKYTTWKSLDVPDVHIPERQNMDTKNDGLEKVGLL